MKYYSFIPLRAGSKGLKNKNILKLNKKELYLYSVEQALRTSDKCFISTDIESILLRDFKSKISVFKRPNKLAGDKILMKDVILDFLSKTSQQNFKMILLQATSPLRSDEDIHNCKKLFDSGKYTMVMSVSKKNKASTKYGFVKGENFSPFFEEHLFNNRQNIPDVYGPNGAIYIFNASDFLKLRTFPNRNIGSYIIPIERSLDIDTIDDFKLAENHIIEDY